jgi:hypothetical protein
VQDKRFDETKDEAALLICFLFDYFVSQHHSRKFGKYVSQKWWKRRDIVLL